MRVLVTLAILIGALWAFDVYEYDGYYRRALLYEFKQTVDSFSRTANTLMTGRGG
jgi:hypothetical protein